VSKSIGNAVGVKLKIEVEGRRGGKTKKYRRGGFTTRRDRPTDDSTHITRKRSDRLDRQMKRRTETLADQEMKKKQEEGSCGETAVVGKKPQLKTRGREIGTDAAPTGHKRADKVLPALGKGRSGG